MNTLVELQGNPNAIDPDDPNAMINPNDPQSIEAFIQRQRQTATANYGRNRSWMQGVMTRPGDPTAAANYQQAMQTAWAALASAERVLGPVRNAISGLEPQIVQIRSKARQQAQEVLNKAKSLRTPRLTLGSLEEETRKLRTLNSKAAAGAWKPSDDYKNRWVEVAKKVKEAEKAICELSEKCRPSSPSEPGSSAQSGGVQRLVPRPDPIASPIRLVSYRDDEDPGSINANFGIGSSDPGQPATGTSPTEPQTAPGGGEGAEEPSGTKSTESSEGGEEDAGSKTASEGCSEEEARQAKEKAKELLTEARRVFDEERKRTTEDDRAEAIRQLRNQIRVVQPLITSLEGEIATFPSVFRSLDEAKATIKDVATKLQMAQNGVDRFREFQGLSARVQGLLAPYAAISETWQVIAVARNKEADARSLTSRLEMLKASNVGQVIAQAEIAKQELETFQKQAEAAIKAAKEAVAAAEAVIDEYEAEQLAGGYVEQRGMDEAMASLLQAVECYNNIQASPKRDAPPAQADAIRTPTVPSVLGMPAEEAKQRLAAAGYESEFSIGEPAPEGKEPFVAYTQMPPAGDELPHGQTVNVTIYDQHRAEGFQPGDGAKVDPRFANAELTDGSLGPLAENASFPIDAPGAGPRCALHIHKDQGRGQNWSWLVKKFATAGGARQIPAGCAKAWESTKNWDHEMGYHHLLATRLSDTDALLHHEIFNSGSEYGEERRTSGYCRAFVYRDVFLIMYARNVPELGYDFSGEVQRIFDASKKLIDLRYPPGSK